MFGLRLVLWIPLGRYYGILRNGGLPLRLAYPIHGKDTFRPSGNPETDVEVVLAEHRSTDTEQYDAYTRYRDRTASLQDKQSWAYWLNLQRLKSLSPRQRKRAEYRERRARERKRQQQQ